MKNKLWFLLDFFPKDLDILEDRQSVWGEEKVSMKDRGRELVHFYDINRNIRKMTYVEEKVYFVLLFDTIAAGGASE